MPSCTCSPLWTRSVQSNEYAGQVSFVAHTHLVSVKVSGRRQGTTDVNPATGNVGLWPIAPFAARAGKAAVGGHHPRVYCFEFQLPAAVNPLGHRHSQLSVEFCCGVPQREEGSPHNARNVTNVG